MSANVYDFQILGTLNGTPICSTPETSVKESAVVAGTTSSITYGDLVVYANGYWAKVADGGANAAGKYGIALGTSTETASADGYVSVAYSPDGLLVKGAATTPANLAQGVLGDKVTLDVTGGVQTVDENDPNGVLVVKTYDSTSVTVVVPYAL